jgi:hypothetical protein
VTSTACFSRQLARAFGQAAGRGGEQRLDLAEVEAGQAEVEALGLELAELDAEQVVVPTGGERQAVGGR